MSVPLLVIVCTHNPRPEPLAATLAGLHAQSLPLEEWALLLVDNASTAPLAARLNLSWHPAARVVREETLGIAFARQRALREARAAGAALILFVDDDNVLAPDYLEQGLLLAAAWPQLGAWGGQLLPQFEVNPPAWAKNYLKYLALTELAADRWTNQVSNYDAVPPTAGCFIRAAVCQAYLDVLVRDPRHLVLGPRGGERIGGEDMDLMLSAIDLGLGLGRFRCLRLRHLIPHSRLTTAYIASLVESIAAGTGLLEYLRYQRLPRPPARGLIERALLAWRTSRLPEPHRAILRAELRGKKRAGGIIAGWRQAAPSSPAENLQPLAARA